MSFKNHGNNCLFRREAAKTNPQCNLHRLRNGSQSLPATTSLLEYKWAEENPRAVLPGGVDMYGRQWSGEGILPAWRESEGHSGCVSRYQSPYTTLLPPAIPTIKMLGARLICLIPRRPEDPRRGRRLRFRLRSRLLHQRHAVAVVHELQDGIIHHLRAPPRHSSVPSPSWTPAVYL